MYRLQVVVAHHVPEDILGVAVLALEHRRDFHTHTILHHLLDVLLGSASLPVVQGISQC